MDKPGLKQFVEALRARLYYSETKGGDHLAQNPDPDSTAVGKYQFLWGGKWPWGPVIKKFAKENGYGEVDKEFFRNNKDLQEEFFEKHYAPKAYEWVKKQIPNNKRNLDLDEIAQLYHMSPKQTLNYIKGGEFKPPGKNSSAKKYLADGLKGKEEFNAPTIEESTFVDTETKKADVNEYISKVDAIKNNKDYTDGAKKMHLKSLKQEYYNKGYSKYINAELGRRNIDEENEKALFTEFHKEILKSGVQSKASGGRPYFHLKVDTEKGKKILDEIAKTNPEIAKQLHKPKSGAYTASLGLGGTKTPLGSYIVDHIKKYSGEDVNNIKDVIEDKRYGVSIPTWTGKIDLDLGDNKNDVFKNYDLNKNNKDTTGYQIANTDVEEKPKITEGTLDGTETPKTATEPSTPVIEEEAAKVSEDESNKDMLAYLDKQYLEVPDKATYDKKDFKQEIPFEAIANAFVGFVGLEQTNTDVPMRTEQVSQGVQDYASKLAKLSQMGLPPELEAKLKNNAAEAYSLMMNNIVEASGGNRNLVLGNQGQADYNRLLANNDVEIADFEQKQLALDKYGEVMSYINEFDSRRDIDNTKVKQALAFDRRQDGRDLAYAGFSSMADSLQQAKDFGPGSANHMLMSQIRQKTFGYDPEMKDDGTGTKKGSRSWYDKNIKDPIERNNAAVDYAKKNLPTLDDSQNKFLNLVGATSSKPEDLQKAIEFAKSNDLSRLNEESVQQAVQNGDYRPLRYNDINQEQFLTEQKQNQYGNKNLS